MPEFDLEPIKAVAPVRPVRMEHGNAGADARSSIRFAPLAGLLSGPVFSRARDIIAANMTELLDRAEDPARMIRVIIIEMEETLVEVRATAARTIADMKEMGRALSRLDRIADNWTEKAELALSKGREDLARSALVERQEAAAMADGLREEIDGLNAVLKGYEQDIARLQGKLREARIRQASISARIDSAMSRARVSEAMHGSRASEAFARFEQLERRADLAEGMADALGMQGPKSLEQEIAELRSSEQVDAALDELKAARGARPVSKGEDQ